MGAESGKQSHRTIVNVHGAIASSHPFPPMLFWRKGAGERRIVLRRHSQKLTLLTKKIFLNGLNKKCQNITTLLFTCHDYSKNSFNKSTSAIGLCTKC